ncbi:MAG: acetate--CoA ligase family protein [Alphaproteobacteria bacterium]|nr:acetate--CoA ligase family protein [Alphaproteobacteria bacterium]
MPQPAAAAGYNKLLDPRSIVVIGVSDQPGNLGARVVGFQKKFGYGGRVYAVNPKRDTVLGERCYRSPAELPEVPDLAILAVSANAALEAVKGCIAGGVRHGILWAGGFAETGAEGAARQQALAELCRAEGFALCGPNTLGILNTHTPVAATFASLLMVTDRLVPGSISMVSQSGGTAIGVQSQAQAAGFGLRYMISSGNEAVLTFPDYLRMLAEDAQTKVVAAYLEGVRDGADFLDALGRLRAAGKPLVMLKAGAAEASARAAEAHTGALTGAWRVWRAVLEEHGAILVQSQRELIDVSIMLAGADIARLPRRGNVAVLAVGAETAPVAASLARRDGLGVPPLAPATRDRLAALLPAGAETANPVVLTEAIRDPARAATLAPALATIAADPSIDAILFDEAQELDPPGPALAAGNRAIAAALADLHAGGRMPVAAAMELDGASKAALARRGLYLAPTAPRASEALGRIIGAHRPPAMPALRPAPLAFDWSRHVPDARAGQVISEHDCHRILAAGGVAVARGRLVRSAAEAAAALVEVGAPVAMKGISPAVTHRAAAGLLLLGVADAAAAAANFRLLEQRAAARGVALDGVYVQHMEPGTHEMIVAAFRDPMFGVMVTCGAGGTATELLDDVAIARAPVDEAGARAILARLRLVRALGPEGPDPAPLAAFIAHFSRLAASIPWSSFELELNPVKWRAGRAVAVDGLLLIAAT